MIRPIVLHPEPSLKEPCKEIPHQNEWWDLWRDLMETINHHKAYGLSAPQIGKRYRIFIFQGIFTVDPKIIKIGSSTSLEEESCLSLPGISVLVERPTWIKVKYTSLTGTKIESKLTGFPARVFQHEYDHLDGILILDRKKEDNSGLRGQFEGHRE